MSAARNPATNHRSSAMTRGPSSVALACNAARRPCRAEARRSCGDPSTVLARSAELGTVAWPSIASTGGHSHAGSRRSRMRRLTAGADRRPREKSVSCGMTAPIAPLTETAEEERCTYTSSEAYPTTTSPAIGLVCINAWGGDWFQGNATWGAVACREGRPAQKLRRSQRPTTDQRSSGA